MSGQEIEIKLNTNLEIIEPKVKNLGELVDSAKNITVSMLDPDPVSGGIFINILKVVNYGGHVRITEKYRSPLGIVELTRTLDNVKPSQVLKMYFPHAFK
jgi:hypothetical protein